MKQKLSARAEKLMQRIEQGKFYPAYGKEPLAMQELKEAGLLRIAGRVTVITACYVPAYGYEPYRPERFTNADK